MVLRRCRHLLRNDAQAQDAMQDVFVALLRHQDRLQDEAPAALMLRVATNVCLNRLRSNRRRPEDADDERLLHIAGSASGEGDGRTLARDLLAKLFRADDPLAASTQTIAVMHLHGEMPRPDRAEALRLLKSAAESGFVTAQLMLGQSYENGQFGARDLTSAMRWYEKAAHNGSVEAQVAMGTAFYLGRGVKKEFTEAARWYREAAQGGDVGAQYLLASMYEQGDGVVRDLRLARYWYEIAAKNGDEAAPGKVKELDRKLNTPGS